MGSAGGSAADVARRQREKAARLNRSAENYEKGAAGEREVAAVLDGLEPSFVVLHDLDVPGSRSNLDHVVIGPTGVLLVDAKAYSGTLKAGSGTLWRGRIPIRKECATAKWEAGQLAAFLNVPVRTVLCFVGTELPAPVTHLEDGITVCSLGALSQLVRSGPPQLRAESIDALARQAAALVRYPSPVTGSGSPTRSSSGSPVTPKRPVVPSKPRFTILRLVGGLVALVAFFAAIPTITRVFTNSLTPSTPTTISAEMPVGVQTVSTQLPDPAGAPLVEAPPIVQFACAASGQGWDITFALPVDGQASGGYHTWYRIGGDAGLWTYAGVFLGGVTDPKSVGAIEPATSFELKYDRDWHYNDPGLATGYAAFTTGVAC